MKFLCFRFNADIIYHVFLFQHIVLQGAEVLSIAMKGIGHAGLRPLDLLSTMNLEAEDLIM